jgi:plastocyanin
MEEQLKHTKNPIDKRVRHFIVLSSFVFFVAAIALVTIFTTSDTHKTKPARVAVVHITQNGFEPATITVTPGTKVIWTSTDDSLHQVASNPYPKDDGLPGLKSEILNNSQSYEYTANKTGTFGYHDNQQPVLNGTLVVQKL